MLARERKADKNRPPGKRKPDFAGVKMGQAPTTYGLRSPLGDDRCPPKREARRLRPLAAVELAGMTTLRPWERLLYLRQAGRPVPNLRYAGLRPRQRDARRTLSVRSELYTTPAPRFRHTADRRHKNLFGR